MMEKTGPASPQCAADMLFHLARSAGQDDSATPLTPAQWAALRFFARASRLSRTPSGFASFHATTRGTASQTVKSLERLGLLARVRAPQDGRSVIFEPTEAGRDRLSRDPMRRLEAALGRLSEGDVRRLCEVLQASMEAVAGAQDAAVLGTCGDCRNLTPAEDTEGGLPGCACTGDRLAPADFDRLCVRYAPDPSRPGKAARGGHE